MILVLTEVYVLISSFEDDKDDGERYINSLKYAKAGRKYLYFNRSNINNDMMYQANLLVDQILFLFVSFSLRIYI